MRLVLAIKSFFKALKEPLQAKQFLDGFSSPTKSEKRSDTSHLRLLSIFQQSARLVDFFKEDLKGCSDAQVGAAVRKIHTDCSKLLEELVTVRPVFEEEEGARVEIPAGYDVSSIKVVGKVKGEPPYSGKLVHKGWRAHKRSLPKQVGKQAVEVIYPAEVEIR